MDRQAKNASAAWKQLDTQKHGYLTKEDIATQYPEINFDTADRNHDGHLSKSEFNKAWKQAYGTGKASKSAMKSSAPSGGTTTQGFTGSSPSSSAPSSSTSSTPSSSSDTSSSSSSKPPKSETGK